MPAKNLRRVSEAGARAHVYNKGVENRSIFIDEADYNVFLSYLEDYLSPPKPLESTKKDFTVNGLIFRGVPHQPKNYFKKVELLAYSLKPDHFHLLLQEKTKNSVQGFLRSLCTRYSIYFNKKYKRAGPLFEGPYKSAQLTDETSLVILTQYLNKAGVYSSYAEYSAQKATPWVKTKDVLSIKNSKGNHKDFTGYKLNQNDEKLLKEIVLENQLCHLERSHPNTETLKPWARIPELLVASIVFAVLLGVGLKNVSGISQNSSVSSTTLGTKTTLASPTSTATPQPKTTLTVKNTDATVTINIQSRPTPESEKIGEAHDGDTFEFVSENSDWYEVKLPDGSTGFISSTYIETGVTNNQSND